MAETLEGGGDSFGFLTRKIGPFPAYVWALIAVAGYYWYTHYGPGAATATVPVADTTTPDVQPGVNGSKFTSNAEWEAAAINFLVGESVPPDEASRALYAYLHSQMLTPQEQKDVNLAIEGIGPPPNIPAPAPLPRNPIPPRPNPQPKPKPKPKPKPVTLTKKIGPPTNRKPRTPRHPVRHPAT